jgi:hypothetical protein
VDDLLLASHDQEKCWEGMKTLLAWLSEAGYKFSGKMSKFASKMSNTSGSSFQTCPRSGEEKDHLFHSKAKDQEGGLRILGSGRILLHLDTQIFKYSQMTL